MQSGDLKGEGKKWCFTAEVYSRSFTISPPSQQTHPRRHSGLSYQQLQEICMQSNHGVFYLSNTTTRETSKTFADLHPFSCCSRGHPSVAGVAAEHPSQLPWFSPAPAMHTGATGTRPFPLCWEGWEHKGKLSHRPCQPGPLSHAHRPTPLPRLSSTYVRQLDN